VARGGRVQCILGSGATPLDNLAGARLVARGPFSYTLRLVSYRTVLRAIVIVVVSVTTAFVTNELVLDLQSEPGTGQTLNCVDPSAFWATFEDCQGQEEHLFWVASLTVLVTGATTRLLSQSRRRSSEGGSHGAALATIGASALAFAGVLLWGFFYDIRYLPPDF
jgi:hypothetical protein